MARNRQHLKARPIESLESGPPPKLPDDQQGRDMMARELLIKFQVSKKHPLWDLKRAYKKF